MALSGYLVACSGNIRLSKALWTTGNEHFYSTSAISRVAVVPDFGGAMEITLRVLVRLPTSPFGRQQNHVRSRGDCEVQSRYP